MAAATGEGLIAGERLVASGPGSSGEEPNMRALSLAMPARRAASVLGGATGVSAGPAGGVATGGEAGYWAGASVAKREMLAAMAS